MLGAICTDGNAITIGLSPFVIALDRSLCSAILNALYFGIGKNGGRNG